MRIIAGRHKGRKIELGKSAAHVRPTSGFTREAIFNILTHGNYSGILEGAHIADIFSGSGALGLEALSRGAKQVIFVDMDHHALKTAMENARRFGEEENVKALCVNALELPPSPTPFQVIFADPPYNAHLLPPFLKRLRAGNWLEASSIVVVEHDAKEDFPLPPGYAEIDARKYGRAIIRLLKEAPL